MKNEEIIRYAVVMTILFALVAVGCGRQPEAEPTPVPQEPTAVQAPTPIPPEPTPSGPISYTIRSGDTLMLLAVEFLGDASLWPEIAAANPGMDPDNIYVGQEILIPRK